MKHLIELNSLSGCHNAPPTIKDLHNRLCLGLMMTLLALSPDRIFSQNRVNDKQHPPSAIEKEYISLTDSLKAIEGLLPGISSIMINSSNVELIAFGQLLHATKFRNSEGELLDIGGKQAFLYTTIQSTYGYTKSARINVGIDLTYGFGLVSNNSDASLGALFSRTSNLNTRSYQSLISIGPKIRWQPIRSDRLFTVQASYLISTVSKSAKLLFGERRNIISLQAGWTKAFTRRLFIFSQSIIQGNLRSSKGEAFVYGTLGLYPGFQISKPFVFFTALNYSPIFAFSPTRLEAGNFQLGIGAQYQFANDLSANLFLLKSAYGHDYQSFSSVSVGVRKLIR